MSLFLSNLIWKNIYVKRLNYEIQILLTNKKIFKCYISGPMPTKNTVMSVHKHLGLERVMHGSRHDRAEKQLLLVK